MTDDETAIDGLLAAVLRGEAVAWSARLPAALGIERIGYHGVAGLITAETHLLLDWPAELIDWARNQTIGQAMWEMRHKKVLAELLDALADAGITALLLKGSALAYDLYSEPSARARGDSDLLVAPGDVAKARDILSRHGFELEPAVQGADALELQEMWRAAGDGGLRHHIDLHWQLLNAPALVGVMKFADCASNPLPIPRLGPGALAMNRVQTLLHTAVHRAMHLTSPYFVDGVTYYGGDRLIWAKDIDLLARALSDSEWRAFTRIAVDQGTARACLDGLAMARRQLGTAIPRDVFDQLGAVGSEPASTYLLDAGQARRAWSDLGSIRGPRRKFAFLAARVWPSAAFMRARYPGLGRWPLAALYLKRMIDVVRPRMSGSERG